MVAIEIRVVIPNLRNGDVADIVQAAPRASIPSAYKWPHIAAMAPDAYVTCVGDVIRANYAQVLAGGGGTVTDAEKKAARNEAIILGSVRAAAAAAFSLGSNDFNAAEVVGTGSRWSATGVGAEAGDTTASANHAVAQTMDDITSAEVDVINMLLYLGDAIPVMQGNSLALTGHHFLPTTRNIFAGMKRQAMQTGGTAVTAWVDALGDKFDDMAFHKACHPILPSLKRGWAKSSAMASRLAASGHGAAAIRLPAMPSDAQAGKASMAVVTKAAPVIKGMGHTVKWDNISGLIRAVEAAPEGPLERGAVDAVRAWYSASLPTIAFCAGIVQYIKDQSGTPGESTLRAFSVRKAMSEHTSEVNRGMTYARAHFSRVRDLAEKGEYPDPAIML
jgi:hypothetical protein